jgi:hypothetical protein
VYITVKLFMFFVRILLTVVLFLTLVCSTVGAVTISDSHLSNVTSASVTLSWVTDEPSDALVNYGLTPDYGLTATDGRVNVYTHLVNITGLFSETRYYFEVTSKDARCSGEFQTASYGFGNIHLVYGEAYQQDGLTPAEGALVSLAVKSSINDIVSIPISTLVPPNGGWWWLDLGNLKYQDTLAAFDYSPGDIMKLKVDAGPDGAVTRTYTISDFSPQAFGSIQISTLPIAVLGEYTVNEGELVTLDASGSSDPDGQIISYQWDLDNDEQYDDAAGGTVSTSFVDNGEFPIGVKLIDNDGASSVASTVVTVKNVAPQNVDAGNDQTASEGATITFNGSFVDPGSADTHVILWDFGDGNTANSTLQPNHIYADNEVYTVTLTVKDNDGGIGTDTLTVTVNNLPPVVEAGEDQTVNEGDVLPFNGSFTEPGSHDTHIIQWNFGNGETASGILTPTCVYTVNGIYTVTLTVADDDGGVGTDTLTVTVNPTAPTITNATGDTTSTTGESVTISATITDDTDVSSATIYYQPIDASETSTPMTEGLDAVWSGEVLCATDKVGTITYYITASEPSGNIAKDPTSGTYNIVVKDNDAPTTITDLTATAATGGAIQLSWSAVADNIGVDHYNVHRDTSAITNLTGRTPIATIPRGTTSYADTTTVDGTTYYYAVAGEDAAGNQAAVSNSPSSVADASSPSISYVTALDITTTSATITWITDEASDSTVYYGMAIPPEQIASDATMVTSHAVTLSGLMPDVTYYYEVQSKDVVGNGAKDNKSGAYYTFTTWSSGDLEMGIWKEQGNPPGKDAHRVYSYTLSDSAINIQKVRVTVGVLSYNNSGSLATDSISPYLEVWTIRSAEDRNRIGVAQTPTATGNYVFESTDTAVIADIVPRSTNEIDVWIKSLNRKKKSGTDVVKVDKVIVDISYQEGIYLRHAPEPGFAGDGETALYQNYSNPFNPETWIPYKLAKSTTATIRIYNITGQLVRQLSLGHKAAGVYVSKDKAAYWDGCDQTGEPVASGVYFYTLQAGKFKATRRMLMVK